MWDLHRLCLTALLFSALNLSIVPICHGHGMPPPPPPPPGLGVTRLTKAYPPRWSWLHWWEANRDSYIESQRTDGNDYRADRLNKMRPRLVGELLDATSSPIWQLRQAAALALGRMAETSAEPRLKALAHQDRNRYVRAAALLALSLLDNDQAESLIRDASYPTQDLELAALCGLGLHSQSSVESVQLLQRALSMGWDDMLQEDRLAPATAAAWALRRRQDENSVKFMQGVLNRTNSDLLASECLIALGNQGLERSVKPLAAILLESALGKRFSAWQELERQATARMMMANNFRSTRLSPKDYDKAYDNYLRQHEKFRKQHLSNTPPAAKRVVAEVFKTTVGIETIFQSRLRASAAIALGCIDSDASRNALHEAMDLRDDNWSDLYKGFVIMSLGQIGDRRSLILLEEILDPTLKSGSKRRAKSPKQLKSPLRGYAALAMGLYARPRNIPSGSADRFGFDKIPKILGRRMADTKENSEVRSAAALALALTQRRSAIEYLQTASKTVGKDDMLIGYTLLARGMCGDKLIIKPARRFLAVANDRDDNISAILGRRAAVLGLGMLGGEQAIPVLIDAWDLSYYVNREVALAFALCQAHQAVEPLLKLLTTADEVGERVFAAQCLGEIYTATRPQRLGWFTNGSNYTVKNEKLLPLQRHANDFLYRYLIAAFGNQWR